MSQNGISNFLVSDAMITCISQIEIIRTVLDAAIQRVEPIDPKRPKNAPELMYMQEMEYIQRLIIAADNLLTEPLKDMQRIVDQIDEEQSRAQEDE